MRLYDRQGHTRQNSIRQNSTHENELIPGRTKHNRLRIALQNKVKLCIYYIHIWVFQVTTLFILKWNLFNVFHLPPANCHCFTTPKILSCRLTGTLHETRISYFKTLSDHYYLIHWNFFFRLHSSSRQDKCGIAHLGSYLKIIAIIRNNQKTGIEIMKQVMRFREARIAM